MHEVLRTNKQTGLLIHFEEGRFLSDGDAQHLEALVTSTPTEIEARARLLGFYLLPNSKKKHLDPERKYRAHILWFVEHMPENAIAPEASASILPEEDPDLMIDLEVLWQKKHVESPNNFNIAFNMSQFFEGACDYLKALEAAQVARRIKGKDITLDKKILSLKKSIKNFPKQGTWQILTKEENELDG